jgi:Phage tail assembly chaperone protein
MDTPEAIKTAWAAYRQALRDLPSTIIQPRTFSAWPTIP